MLLLSLNTILGHRCYCGAWMLLWDMDAIIGTDANVGHGHYCGAWMLFWGMNAVVVPEYCCGA